ncbi:NAD(P)-dependent oxidoreductase [Virgibacillus profundi]|uniref:NAD(P)-dependent oxidoreductase n=1 Tax=Virgibacillus profundi TaxID=2024555 RepID=A0A2A2IDM2_9BACI|nr:SDR family oxidoreductase [Virgibacillus profundi]PAV29230.1 NAD(P)-dependent oxidoreductase [Virgibacillus profundi]PXY53399.1 3-oxoacyl-ACP reductase [Virgibacillus profundi]
MGMEHSNGKQTPPAQHQDRQPGLESKMHPEPEYIRSNYQGSNKLKNKVALITGGDSGIGRAVSVHFAKEGADLAIVYLDEHEDANETKRLVEQAGQKCLLINGDIGNQSFCEAAVTETLDKFKKIDILINNAAEQHPQGSFLEVSSEQIEQTFRTNVFGMFHMTKAALPSLKNGSSIINTSSITAYQGSKDLIDYAATKGAITSFTRSLASALADQGIRVNGVAPGPIWTPLIPASFSEEKVDSFGGNTPMKRPGQPQELAPAYVYLACEDSSYVSGQMIHVNGGIIVSG